MQSKTANERYPATLIALHWLTFTLVVMAYALAELKGFAERGSDLRGAMLRLHYRTGLHAAAALFSPLPIAGQCAGADVAGVASTVSKNKERLI